MKPTLKCYGCGEQFPRGDIINYTSSRAKTGHNYCPNCLNEVKAKEMFIEKVCHIFGIKAPGPRIWTERKRIIETYGYTDQIIVDCLDYVYNIQKSKKLSDSLFLVNPINVEKMMKYKAYQEYEKNKIISAFVDGLSNKPEPRRVHVRENVSKKSKWNIDDEFFDD